MKNLLLTLISLGLLSPLCLQAATLNVGATETYKTPCAAIAVAVDGDTILIDPGTYTGDTCAFSQNNLTIEGTDPTNRPIINITGTTPAQYKGIWVPYGSNFTVENVEMEGAAISDAKGGNAAAIRESGQNWTVENCYIHNNQMGILESNVVGSVILIEYSEFANNGLVKSTSKYFGHAVYVGNTGASFTFQYNYSHDDLVGHLLKTRAGVNYILYNRLTGQTGTDSLEVDIPNGGTSYVIGNLIQKGPNAQNAHMLGYLEEGTTSLNPGQDLYVTSNTFVNQYGSGAVFMEIASTTPALAQDNIFYGGGTLSTQSNTVYSGNYVGDPSFVDVNNYNYNLSAGSPAINAATSEGVSSEGYSLVPAYQYVHPTCGETRQNAADIGGLAYMNSGTMLNCLP